jgi:hypothetical protein
MFPTRNNEIAPYNNVLNIAFGIYFSANANRTKAEKPTATKVKHMFFRLFIMSLGIIISYPFSSLNTNYRDASYHVRPRAEIECTERSGYGMMG